jgi:hypothetical protein
LSAQWHPETRTRCLTAIRRMKKMLADMARREISEAASTNGSDVGDIRATDITPLFAEDLLLNPQAAVTAAGEGRSPVPEGRTPAVPPQPPHPPWGDPRA